MLPKKMCSKYSQKHAKHFKYEEGGNSCNDLGLIRFQKVMVKILLYHTKKMNSSEHEKLKILHTSYGFSFKESESISEDKILKG